jgi:hypothetical protein
VCAAGQACVAGQCATTDSACVSGGVNLPAGTVVPSTSGDCHANQCDGSGHVVSVIDNTDTPPQTGTCTTSVCTAGVPSQLPSAAGTSCGPGGAVCDGTGNCVTPGCPAGQSLCGGVCTTVSTDVLNCGACGQVCPVNNASPACVGGACTIASCNAGFANCNGAVADGCETNLFTSLNNCGACGHVCAAGQSCTAGACVTSASACVSNGIDLPVGTVVPSASGDCHASQCDGAGNVVSIVDNSDVPPPAVCMTGTCTAGQPTQTPLPAGTSCGTGLICNGAGGCVTGTTCSGGQVLCGGVCTSLGSDLLNCGACGQVCSTNNANAACIGGTCTVITCNAGFANCNGTIADGCETNLTNSPTNCGACGHVCGTGFSCSSATCVQNTLGNGSACTSSSQCGSGSCAQGVCCNTSCNSCAGGSAQACNLPNSIGTCVTVACSPFVCSANACATTCGSDANCAAGFVCNAGVCTTSVNGTTGSACTNGTQCLSGICNGGFCQ